MKSEDSRRVNTQRGTVLPTVGFVGILIVALIVSGAIADRAARKDVRQKAAWTFMHVDRHYDFLVLGSSRAYTTTDVHTIEDTLGSVGINIAEDGAGYRESEMVFDHFIAHNSACTLLMEVDWFGFDTTRQNANVWKYVPFLGDSLVDSYVHEADPAKFYLWKWIPFTKYAEFNERIGWRSVLHILRHAPSPFDDRGTYLLDGAFVVPEGTRHTVARTHNDSSLDNSLKRIIQTARAHHMSVVLYMAPEFGGMLPLFVDRPKMIDYYRSLARDRDMSFLWFDELRFVADSSNFRDAIHLNRRGAIPFSAALAHKLKARGGATGCNQANSHESSTN